MQVLGFGFKNTQQITTNYYEIYSCQEMKTKSLPTKHTWQCCLNFAMPEIESGLKLQF